MAENYSRPTKILAFIAWALIVQAMLRGCRLVYDRVSPMPGDIGSSSNAQAWALFCFLAAAVGVGMLTFLLAKAVRQESQKIRDEVAQRLAGDAERLLETIAAGEKIGDFVLYLRPFALEPHLRQLSDLLSPRTLFLHPRVTFDYMLLQRLDALQLPLLCIGMPGDVGAGRVVVSDSDWRLRFRELAALARTIVVVPGKQPGIRSEINWLRVAGLLRKAVFFKPTGYPREEWLAIQRVYEEEEDIELPDYLRRQVSFRLLTNGQSHDVMFWHNVFSSRAIARGEAQLDALLTNRPLDDD
jgi:membrane protein implicated in regulation of membrane protease activity